VDYHLFGLDFRANNYPQTFPVTHFQKNFHTSKNRLLFFPSKDDVATNRNTAFYNNTARILGTQSAFDELLSIM